MIFLDSETEPIAPCNYSTRSHTGFNCAALAKRHGGGGHAPAAGFTVSGGAGFGDLDPYQRFSDAFFAR